MIKTLLIIALGFTNPISAYGILQKGGEIKPLKRTVKIERIKISRDISHREPVDERSSFSDTIGVVYCFTEVVGSDEPTFIIHRWFYQNKEMASVKLRVEGRRWRTWSSKAIMPQWTGNWRVDVIDNLGRVLKSKEFRIVPAAGKAEGE